MKIKLLLISIVLLSVTSGCYGGLSGRVIDSETQQPIEGAVMMVEWTKTHGMGEHWTESYQVEEAVSDKDGNVKISGCYDPFVDPPSVTVYKKGYVAWNNEYIFPKYRRRTDFDWWKSGKIFKMEKFLSIYRYLDHSRFINRAANFGMRDEKKTMLYNVYIESEGRQVQEEQEALDRSKRSPR